MREQVIERIEKEKLIAIVRGVSADQCSKVANALYAGGVRLMEITYNQKDPASWQQTAEAIGALTEEFGGKMLFGAGTVTNVELVELTHAHGGKYIISPDTNVDVIKRTVELGMVSLPGAMTPTEVLTAHAAGADFVKLFPAGDLGVSYLKAIRAPISHVKLMAVGGVNESNAADFLKAGAVGLGIGGNLAKKAWIDAGEFDKLTEAAKTMVEIIKSVQ